jgi:hypothetical protein
MIGADVHDLGIQILELRQRRLEALELFRSGRGEGRNEGVDDDGALGRQVRELDGLAVDAVQREVGRFLPDLEGARGTDEGALIRTAEAMLRRRRDACMGPPFVRVLRTFVGYTQSNPPKPTQG